jgi:transcriptional regulator with XRE-family HTH domain
MKTRQREEARRLRRQGLSVKQIERSLGVARSSVSMWVRDIELTEAQRAALTRDARTRRTEALSAYFRSKRRTHQDEGRAAAKKGDPHHAAGCMLYWAEGAKRRNTAALSNSDPELIRYFLAFLRAYFDVSDEKVRVWCNLFADHLERQQEIEQFWLSLLELPRSCLTR